MPTKTRYIADSGRLAIVLVALCPERRTSGYVRGDLAVVSCRRHWQSALVLLLKVALSAGSRAEEASAHYRVGICRNAEQFDRRFLGGATLTQLRRDGCGLWP